MVGLYHVHRTIPNMVEMLNCTNVIVESLKVYNSPRYHFHLMNMTNLIVRDMVNVTAQQELYTGKEIQ